MTARTAPAFLDTFAGCLAGWLRPRPRAAEPGPMDPAEEARVRRALIDEAIARNPDAFASDLDVQCFCEFYGRAV